jgi:hypothetical protein
MAEPEHSFRERLPGFVIAAATQVVFKVPAAKAIDINERGEVAGLF